MSAEYSCHFSTEFESIIEFASIEANNLIDKAASISDAFFLIDENVFRFYFQGRTLDRPYFLIKSNEQEKSLKQSEAIYSFLLKNNCSRSNTIVAIGGGITTDLAAWVASTFKRGVKLWLVPTTLLSMVDAGIGGKAAVNYQELKNALGCFYPAERIIICSDFLKTLDEKEYYNGLVEGIKTLIILKEFQRAERILNTKTITDHDIEYIARAKLGICQRDLHDKGERRLLNLGHSFAHIFESISNYLLPHGIAVAWGLSFAVNYSYEKQLLNVEDKTMLESLINKLLIINDESLNYKKILFNDDIIAIIGSKLRHLILNDKKNENAIKLVLFEHLDTSIYTEVSIESLERFIIAEFKRIKLNS